MDENKVYDLMEKMYSELLKFRNESNERFDGLENKASSLESNVNKNTITLEELEKKVDTIVEIQKSHMEENEKHHIEIVEMLSEKIDTTRGAVRLISRSK